MLPWLLPQMCSLWSEQAVPAPAPATCSGVQHARSAACRASWLAAAPVHGPALVTYSRLRMCPWMAPTLRFSASFTLPLFWAWVRGLLPQVAHCLARGGHAHISRLPTTYRYGACCRPKGPDRMRAGTEVCVLHYVAGPICWRGSSAWCCCTWTCRVRWLHLPAAAESSQMDFVKHRQLAHASRLPTSYTLPLHTDPAVDMGAQGPCAVISPWAGLRPGCAAQGLPVGAQHGSWGLLSVSLDSFYLVNALIATPLSRGHAQGAQGMVGPRPNRHAGQRV